MTCDDECSMNIMMAFTDSTKCYLCEIMEYA